MVEDEAGVTGELEYCQARAITGPGSISRLELLFACHRGIRVRNE